MKRQKPQCKYGDKCYRQNPQHFREYSHGSQSESEVRKVSIVTAGLPIFRQCQVGENRANLGPCRGVRRNTAPTAPAEKLLQEKHKLTTATL